MSEIARHKANGAPTPQPVTYRFADLTLHVGQHRLERNGNPVELGRLTYGLLVALVESAPNVLTHDDLVRLVWGGRSTTPETVTQRVKLLRDALGDDAQRPRYVGLVRGGGYRLIPSVERLEPPSASGQPENAASAALVDTADRDSTTPIDRSPARHRSIALATAAAVLLVLVMAGAYTLLVRVTDPDAEPAKGSNPLAFEITRLTSSGRAAVPSISPDGKFVAYLQQMPGDPVAGRLAGLWIRQIGTNREVQIVAPEPDTAFLTPTISPDGQFVDYIKSIVGKGLELWPVPVHGGAPPKRLRSAPVASPIGWSPDGKHFAFVSYDANARNSLLVEVDDRFDERVLATRTVPDLVVSLFITGVPPIRPAYSPDGRFIAIAEFRDVFAPRITVIDRETRAEKSYDSQGSFSPHGLGWLGPSTLVVSQPAVFGQRIQLFKMSYPDGAVEPLTRELASYIGIDLDASRSRLVTTLRDVRTSIWLADASGSTAVQLVPPAPVGTPEVFVTWAGDRVVYDSTFDGHATISAVPIGGGPPEEVVPDGIQVAAAPDGSALVFYGATHGREGLWKVDAPGQPPIQLVPGFAMEPVVTPDRVVVYASNVGRIQSPWSVPLDGGEPTEIVQEQVDGIDVSPDGRMIAFFSSSGIVVCELPHCSTNRRDLPFPPSVGGSALRWTPDGKEIAYVEGLRQNIWAVPVDGGPPHALTRFGPDTRAIFRFAFSRDGRLAFVRVSIEHDVVLLSGLRP